MARGRRRRVVVAIIALGCLVGGIRGYKFLRSTSGERRRTTAPPAAAVERRTPPPLVPSGPPCLGVTVCADGPMTLGATDRIPKCMGPLVCPEGTTRKPTLGGEQCFRPDGVADGPGHANTGNETPPGFMCWEMKAGKLTGTSYEFSSAGVPKYEFGWVDGERDERGVDYDRDGHKSSESYSDGSTLGYFPGGQRKFAGAYRIAQRVPYKTSAREGVWTRWFENGQRRFQCEFVRQRLSGTCTAWDEAGTVVATATYADGWLRSGKQVYPFFSDDEPAIAGAVQAPTAPIDVGPLVEDCRAFDGQSIQVTGTVLEVYRCGHCPPGAMCKPCSDMVILGDPERTRQLQVTGTWRSDLRIGEVVTIRGQVAFSAGQQMTGSCTVRYVATLR